MNRVAIVLTIGTLLSISANAQPRTIRVDVAQMPLDQAPAQFMFARTGQGPEGRWLVVRDETAQRGRSIAQVNQDSTNYRFPLAIYEPFTAKNVEVTVRFKPVSGKVDQAGGIAIRVASPDDYYVVRANALEDNVRFYRVVKGEREQLADANMKVASNEWHTLGLKAVGSTFTVSFDGKFLYAAQDSTFSDPGQVALWTKADSVTHFDSLMISEVE